MFNLRSLTSLPGAARRDREREVQARVAEELKRIALLDEVDRRVALARDEGAAPRLDVGAVLQSVRSALWRGRVALQPVWALLAALVGGWAVWLDAAHPVNVGLGWTLAAVGWWWLRGRRRLDRRPERVYAAGCLSAAGVWLVSCAVWSPAGRGYLLLWGWLLAALIWWVPGRHWPRDWRPPAVYEEPVVDEKVALWEANIAAANRCLPGSRVLTLTWDEHRAQVLTVQGVPGVQTAATATLNMDMIASGLEEPDDQVIVEKAPRTTNPKRVAHLIQVKILPESPIDKVSWFEKPRFRDGKILLGSYLDHIGEGAHTVYDLRRKRMRGGMTFGGTGSGKSRLADTKVITMRSPEWQALYPTVVVYLDGQNGASSPLLWRHATIRGGPAEAPEILEGLLRVGRVRQKYNVYHELDGYLPGRSPAPGVEPLVGIYVLVDEQHSIVNEDTVAAFTIVARELGKVGFGVDGHDQITDLSAFGDDDALRSSMLVGNGFAMHIASKTAGSLVPGLTVDPYKLPAIPGYLTRFETPGSDERVAPMQVRWMPDRQAVEDGIVVPDDVRLVEDWYPLGADAELDEMSARAFGPMYLEREERRARDREQLAAEMEGREVITVNRPGDGSAAPAAAVSDGTLVAAVRKVLPGTGLTDDEAVLIGRELLGLPLAAAAGAEEYGARVVDMFGTAPATDEETSTTREVVRAYMRVHRRASRAAIHAHVKSTVGTSLSALKQVLRTEVEQDYLDREPGREGIYVALPKLDVA